MSLKEIVSEKGNIMLVFDNFKFFKKDSLKSGEIKWSCGFRKCNAKLYTLGEGSDRIISRRQLEYNQEPDVEKIHRQIISVAAKRKATEEISSRPSKVFHGVLKNLKETEELKFESITLSDRNCIRRNIYNARRKKYPPLPQSIEDVHCAISSLSLKTIENENFVLVNDSEENIIIFSCEKNLRFLTNCDNIYVDGTFSYCTKFFVQLFSIHGFMNGHYVPLVFCLVNDKRTETYEKCFKLIKSECQQLQLNFEPKSVTVDFELAIHNAINRIWHEIIIVGCRFHLSQAWWRKIQELGLSVDYKSNSPTGKWLKYTFGLQYLPPDEVYDCFVSELVELAPPEYNAKLIKYVDYLIETYISPKATFPPSIWASASASSTRTTNNCESFHAHFNSSFYICKPSLYIFIETLLEYQVDTYVKMNSVHIKKKIASNTLQKYNRLDVLLELYRSKSIKRCDFVKQVYHNFAYNML